MENIMKKFARNISLRFVIQSAIVLTVLTVSLLHLNFGIEKAAPIDAYCPFGAVESFFTLIFNGEFLKRIFTSSFILLGIFFIATIILGMLKKPSFFNTSHTRRPFIRHSKNIFLFLGGIRNL